jgi:small-conductance mechanosensitive channel
VLRAAVFALLLLVPVSLAGGPALAQPAATAPGAATAARPALTADEARRALETLQDDKRRAQVIETLRALAAAAPPAAQGTAPAPQNAPAAATAQPAAEDKPADKPQEAAGDKLPQLAADSLAAQLLFSVSRNLDDLTDQIGEAARSVTRFPLLVYWVERTFTDRATYDLLLDIGWKLALVMGAALAAEWLVARGLRRVLVFLEQRLPATARRSAEHAAPDVAPLAPSLERQAEPRRRRVVLTRAWQSLIRLPYVLARFVVDLCPVLAFAAVATLLLGSRLGDIGISRLVILSLINAYAIARAVECVARLVVSAGPLSLVTVRQETAAYLAIWVRRLITVGAFGFALANVAYLLGLYTSGYLALLRIVMLVVHLLVVVIILQCRRTVAQAIRVSGARHGALTVARNRIAALWHVPAIALVLALWLVWALNVRNGYALLLQYFVGTAAVVLAARLVAIIMLGLIDRLFRIHPDLLQKYPGLEARANHYLPLLRNTVSTVIGFAAFVAMLEVWGIDAVVWFAAGAIGSRLVGAVATIAIAVFAALAAWEFANAMMERRLTHLAREGHYARAARLRTFMPMLRTALLAVIVVVVGLTALSEIGINVAPLLAGAGILGIAIGFGSQKLVQDLITGLFLLLENVVQVGDNVTVSGLSGTVENLSIRTIRLRASDGSVHIVPFSAVTSVTNASRGKGNAAISVAIAFREDSDRASMLIKTIGAELRDDADFRHLIRSDLELWGVDKVDGTMVTLVGQIPCTDSGRWPVQREFNRRLKQRFQAEGIAIASAAPTVVLQPAPPPETERPGEAAEPRAAERRRAPARA